MEYTVNGKVENITEHITERGDSDESLTCDDDDALSEDGHIADPQTSIQCTVFNTGQKRSYSFLEQFSQRCLQNDITRASMEQECLIFLEKMKNLMKKSKREHLYQQNTYDCSMSCTSPLTVSFSSIEEEDDSMEILDTPLLRHKIKVDMSNSKDQTASKEEGKVLHSVSQERNNPMEHGGISTMTAECARLYNAKMHDVCSAKKVPPRLKTKKGHQGDSRTETSNHFDFCDQMKKELDETFRSNLNAVVKKSGKTKYRFYILVTSDEVFFEETKVERENVESDFALPTAWVLEPIWRGDGFCSSLEIPWRHVNNSSHTMVQSLKYSRSVHPWYYAAKQLFNYLGNPHHDDGLTFPRVPRLCLLCVEHEAQLETEGHTAVQPSEFFLGEDGSSSLLIILRNEDIAEHICKIPDLLKLKMTPGVLFAGIDEPDDVLNLTHQELFIRAGFVMFDRAVLEPLSICNMKKISKNLEELSRMGKWKWMLHYRDSRRLKENARLSEEANQKKLFVYWCQDAGILEVLPYHECDQMTRDQPDYLECLLRLQVQHISSRFPVFVTAICYRRRGFLYEFRQLGCAVRDTADLIDREASEMCENYARSLLRVSVAQICQALGWDAVQLTACDLLSDVLHRYIQQLARVCHRYSELYGRTDPVLDDLSQAFRLMGVNLSELEDYVNNLEPVAFTHQTPLFPVNKNNVLQFPQPGVRDAEERKDYIPEYMPPLVSLQEAEEEEEEVPPDMGTSAEAMQVALEEDEEEIDEDEMVNDENHPLKRHLDSPDAALGMMPTSKRPRMYPGLSPEWGVEPREPLTSLNPQRVPPGILPSHDSLDLLSPETPSGALPPFRPQPVIPKHSDQKTLVTPVRKPKVSSPGRQRTKSPKGVIPVPVAGSPIHSPKPSKERKKSPGRTKSPKSPKSPKMSSLKAPPPQIKVEGLHKLPLSAVSERMGKENIHLHPGLEDPQIPEGSFKILEPDNTAIDDSIAAVIARACAERDPDPFAFSSGSDSDSNGFSSPRRLTIMEPSTPKVPIGAGNFIKDTSTPLYPHAPHPHIGLGNWTLDDSINEVIRKANQGGPSALPPPPPPPPNPADYVSSGSASPPTPEPLLKMFEERNKIVPPADVKKKLKKELKTKMKKKEKDKPKDKDREKDKSKLKEKNKEKNREKNKEFSKDIKMPWKEFGMKDEDLFMPRDFTLPEGSIKIKSRDGEGPKKEKEKHKDKKKDKEKSKKDKDKKEKNKDRSKEEKQKHPSTCLRVPSMLPSLAPILHEKEVKSKEKEKKKDKKEKKKKKDKDKEREKAKEKEREKEEKRKEKEREKEKREKEKEKEKEKIRLEKVKMETPAVLPSPVIPRLTLRVGAGQDKIVISKVVSNSTPKTPGNQDSCCQTPVRSVVTETVSTYVVRDEWGNQIWICPGCNKPDDGSPMIGCDDCDDWYHWPCVGILTPPPEDQPWFCVKCSSKKKDKKHKKKKHKPH
ncbi:hypothetical protein CRENBAI_015310 [Crenichthys baileyi]|uniref:Transcription initiation factor TFIID subunit 3 n=1 Tax=Crenichthys baileyi TaxID=28760 RepID=A0AAV9R814_9TELE